LCIACAAVGCGDDDGGDVPPDDAGGAGQAGQRAGTGGASGSGSGGRSGSGGSPPAAGSSGASAGRGGTSGDGGSGGSRAPTDGGLDASADAGPQDAAMQDAANPSDLPVDTTDRDLFFGDARCDGLDVLLCESFEEVAKGQLPGAPFTVRAYPALGNAGAPTMAVDDARAARGARSLHLVVGDRAEAYLRVASLFPEHSGRLFGRVFFYAADPVPEIGDTVHWNVVEGTGPNGQGGTKFVRYGGTYNEFDNGGYIFNFDQRPRPSGFNELARGDTHNIETGKWICVEWSFTTTEARLYRDGVEVTQARGMSPINGAEFTFPTYDGLNIGWAIYQDVETPFEVWVDEIALDDERIGCAR
jgi:hypothetical protein